MNEWGGRRAGAFAQSAAILGISDSAFTLIRDLIEQRTGIYYDDAKRDLLTDKLTELVTARGMTSFLDYYYLLKYDTNADSHWKELMDRLSVPETYFWRQSEQLDILARIVAPQHFERAPNTPLRIWSAACCTGEEPISIAIALAEVGILGSRPIEIVASDGSRAMVERARRGFYGERSFRTLPTQLKEKYFRAEPGGWRVAQWILEQVRWTTANLLEEAEIAPLATADVIFCRNVFIYFSDEAIQRVVHTLAQRMPPNGHLFLGASESLTRLTSEFDLKEMDGGFVYVPAARSTAGDPRGTEARNSGRAPGSDTSPERVRPIESLHVSWPAPSPAEP